MIVEEHIDTLQPEQLRAAVRALMSEVQSKSREVAFKQATIDKLTHEMAVLKRLKFAAKSEGFNTEQKSLLEEAIDADLAALAAEIEAQPPKKPAVEESSNPGVRSCRRTCLAGRSATSPRPPPASAAGP